MKLLVKKQAKRDVEQNVSDIKDYIVPKPTPTADELMRQYLLDSIAWLDEGAE